MTDQHILTIDLGTSGPKAAVVSITSALVGAARASVSTTFGPGGAAEQDAESVWAATLEAATGALAAAAVDPSSVVGIVASAQYSSIVPVSNDCTPVAPMITWMDQRGAPKRLRRLPGYPKLGDSPQALARFLRVHGLAPVSSGMSLTHMRWFRYARPELYERTASFLEPVDYLTARFTGRPTANQCSSFMQMLADNRTVPSTGWDKALVTASMIDAAKLPEPVAVGSIVGTLLPAVSETLGLPPSTPVLSGINDTQAGGIAANAISGSHAGLALGTTAVIVTHLGKKKVNPLRSLWTHAKSAGWLPHALGGERRGRCGGRLLPRPGRLPRRSLRDPPIDRRSLRGVHRCGRQCETGSGGRPLPALAPGIAGPTSRRTDARGFVNVGLDTTRSDLARALLEGVALNARWLQGPVEKFIGRQLSHYVFYGGGARSDLWSALMADVLGKPVHQMTDPAFANSLGTAVFGFDRLGLAAAADHRPRINAVYEPNPAQRARYDDLAEIFADAFKRTRPLMHHLATRADSGGHDAACAWAPRDRGDHVARQPASLSPARTRAATSVTRFPIRAS